MNRGFRTIGTFFFFASAALTLGGCGGTMQAPASPIAAERPSMESSMRGASAPAAAPADTRAKSEGRSEAGNGKPGASAELLAYEATVTLGVYRVEQAVKAVLAASRDLGGQVVLRDDAEVVFRVPCARFEEALSRVDAIGDVVHRDVRAEDVGEHYRDLDVRLRNARAVRERLAELLARAVSVEDSLKIEAQLGRVTEDIERLAGELELLGSRVAYSKITVSFEVRHAEEVHDDVMRLPFPWLKTLGLPKLLDLAE